VQALPEGAVCLPLFPEESHVVCPICGDAYIHMTRIVVEQPTQTTTVRQSKSTIERHEENGSRGTQVTIRFACEANGHCFDAVTYFHKGCTYAYAKHRPDQELGNGCWLEEMERT